MRDLIKGESVALPARSISAATAKHFGYEKATFNGKTVQTAPYYDDKGALVAQKVRFPNKEFTVVGDLSKAQLFGAQLYNKGKMLVVVEGEVDALSIAEAQGTRWPVVSLPNGAQGARKALAKHLEYLERFESIILMFDMDEPGQKAAEVCSGLFTPGKCKVAHLPLKDANEMLVAGRGKELIAAIWNAKIHRPDGIVDGIDLWDVIRVEDSVTSIAYPWSGLNELTRGCRQGELVTITAGSGIGKSAIIREMAYHMINHGETVGMIMLEESTKRTSLGLMGLHLNKPIHIDRDGVTEEELKAGFDATIGSGKVFLYDHFGSTELDNLLSRVRYLAKACNCSYIFLDHLSIVVSGLGDGDERRLIDNAMTQLRTIVQETGVGLLLVSHLRRSEGDKGYENGKEVTLNGLRGSHSIVQLSDMVIAASRDQQGDNPNMTKLTVLKNRFTGHTGKATFLGYSTDTGRLTEVLDYEEVADGASGYDSGGF